MKQLITAARLASVLLLLAALGHAQRRQWIVDSSGGPGVDFTDLPPAVTAAAAGDVILVRAGSYHGFALDKGLAIEGTSATILPATGIFAAVRIQNLPAGHDVALRGFAFADTNRPLSVIGCQGRVLLERLTLNAGATAGAMLAIETSSQVTIAGGEWRGRPGIDARLSTVTITDAMLLGGGPFTPLAAASPALVATGARVLASRCTMTGGSNFPVSASASAIVSRQSQLTITDDGSHRLESGAGVRPATIVNDAGSLVLDPAVVFGPGVPVSGTGTVTTRPVPSLRALGVPIGNVVDVDLFSPAGDIVLLMLSTPGDEIVLPDFGGSAFLDLSRLLVPAVGFQGATSHFRFSLQVPPDPVLVGVTCVWQGLSGTLAGAFRISNPAAYVH